MSEMNRRDETPSPNRRFPTLTEIIGAKGIQKAYYQLSQIGKDADSLFHQAEIDLRYLKRRLSVQALRDAYKKQLLDKTQFIQGVYEIYTAALLASVSENIELHARAKNNKDCDFRVTISGYEIYGEVKTRHDQFPPDTPPTEDGSGENLYMASRATVDPHVAEAGPHPEIDKPIPESTELRRRMMEALEQLPDACPNIVVLGLIGQPHFSRNIQFDLKGALFGDEFFKASSSSRTPIQSRHPNGIFADDRYGKQLTSVAWLSLKRTAQGITRRSGIFFNPNAQYCLSEEVELQLERLFDREKFLRRELEGMIEKLKSDYRPEKIILFGSLAQGNVKEGSDIDLTIIKKTDKRPLDRCLEVADITQPSVAVNFIVYTPEEFEKERKAGNFFVVDEILKEGRVLYER
jgi:predicted nucleotidyltransferase